MKEIWKNINGYNGFYKISNYGNVYNSKWDRPLKQHINKGNGYYDVQLYNSCQKKHFTIHRLVALHFVDNPKSLGFVNHKDGNKHNNYFMNLEWVTKSENSKHAGRAGLISVNLRKKVDQYSMDGQFIKTHESISNAARELNLFKTNISSCCLNKPQHSTCGGFVWRFNGDNN